MKEWRLKTELADTGKRLDSFLAESLDGYSRSYLQKLIGAGEVLLLPDDPEDAPSVPKSSYRLSGEESLLIRLPDSRVPDIEAQDIPLDIVYEDADLLVVNKPKGMVVHPAAGHGSGTLVNALLYHCGNSLSGINGVLRPGIVHRIDKDTSGLLLVCKNDAAHQEIARQLKEHSLTRRYTALAVGQLPEEGTVRAPIGRDRNNRLRMAVDPKGKPAVTHYRVLEYLPGHSLCECRLETGRTHQIRVHLASLRHPLAGDTLYGAPPVKGIEGQCLHAKVLGFVHPRTGGYMEFSSGLPVYFEEYLRKLRERN